MREKIASDCLKYSLPSYKQKPLRGAERFLRILLAGYRFFFLSALLK